jgi:hypothetical protein
MRIAAHKMPILTQFVIVIWWVETNEDRDTCKRWRKFPITKGKTYYTYEISNIPPFFSFPLVGVGGFWSLQLNGKMI